MLRLFSYATVLLLANLFLALATDALFFRLIVLVIGLGIVGLYWFLRRSQPPTGGSHALEGLREPVDIYRDDRGVPHLYARNLHDLYFAQGYVTAQDRLWQMEISRRAATGRLAEMLGEQFLDRDKHLRTLDLRRVAERSLALYSNQTLDLLRAYAEGVNAFLAQGTLPPEFLLLRTKPEAWTVVDSLLVSKLLAYEVSNSWADELLGAQLSQTTGPEMAAALLGEAPDPALVEALSELVLPDLDDLFHLAAAAVGTIAGSNAWVIASNRSRSGHPMLGSDLHASPKIPATWHQVHLVGPDRLDLTGITFPGMPGLVSGHTRDFAWSLSGLGADTQDLVLERIRPDVPGSDQDQVVQVAYEGGWEEAEHRTESILVRGWYQPATHEVMVTRHGPVLARGADAAIALRSTALAPSAELESLLAMNRARSYAEFQAAARTISAPAQAVLYAGRDGTIARLVVGAVPIRSAGSGQYPALGWTGADEWQGLIPPDQLPEELNPPDGFLVAANQDLTPPGYPYPLASPWAPAYRAQRLTERLRGSIEWSRERGEELQVDTVNPQARGLIEILLNQLHQGLHEGPQPDHLTELEKRALLMISGWNFTEGADSAPALLWQQWYLFLLEGIFRPQMGLRLFDQFVASRSAIPIADRLLAQVAAGQPNPWLELSGEKGLPRIALRAFRRAVALLAAKYGKQPERWAWGKEHKIRFLHPLSRRFPALASLFDLGPFPIGGSHSTINFSSYNLLNPFAVGFAAPYRRVVDMGLPEEATDISAPGVSGHPLSPFFSDQLALWQRGDYAPQPMRHTEIRRFPRLQLTPAAPPTYQ